MRERVKGPDLQVSFLRLFPPPHLHPHPPPSSVTPVHPPPLFFRGSLLSCRRCLRTGGFPPCQRGGCGRESCRSAGLEPHAGTARLCKCLTTVAVAAAVAAAATNLDQFYEVKCVLAPGNGRMGCVVGGAADLMGTVV